MYSTTGAKIKSKAALTEHPNLKLKMMIILTCSREWRGLSKPEMCCFRTIYNKLKTN